MKVNLKKLKTVTIVVIIAVIIMIITVKQTIKQKQINIEVDDAKQKVSEYLNEKYQQTFNLELEEEGYKGIYATDGTFGGMVTGYYDNIREFIFGVSTEQLPIESYITLWKNTDTNEIEINEIKGYPLMDTSFEKLLEIYNGKMEIKNKLDKILSENYQDYNVDYNFKNYHSSNRGRIDITFRHPFKDELNNNFENIIAIAELIDGPYYIVFKFPDIGSANFSYSDGINSKENYDRSRFFLGITEIYNCLDTNYIGDYYIENLSDDSIYVRYKSGITESDYLKNKPVYDKLLQELTDINKRYDDDFLLDVRFKDGGCAHFRNDPYKSSWYIPKD